jgi:hypothetical protein
VLVAREGGGEGQHLARIPDIAYLGDDGPADGGGIQRRPGKRAGVVPRRRVRVG